MGRPESHLVNGFQWASESNIDTFSLSVFLVSYGIYSLLRVTLLISRP